MQQTQALPSTVVGPFCPLLTQRILRRHVNVLPVRRRRSELQDAAGRLQTAKLQVKGRQRGQAEWTYALLIRVLLGAGEAADGCLAEAFYCLALVSQKRDVELARYAFQLSLRTCVPGDTTAASKYLVSWGLLESKQPGHIPRAQRLLKRAVALDPSKAPVLKWKCIFGLPVKLV
jgi:hypothetical protein